jgi:Mor family transcriptional regulator
MRIEPGAPELLAYLHETVVAQGVAEGIEEGVALRLAGQLIHALSRDWGGQLIYVGKNTRMKVRSLHLDLYRDFTGANHAELAGKYGYSVQRVYSIIAQVRQQMAGADQRQLDILERREGDPP